jgi:uncharacterized membrane protein YfhO
MTRTSLIRSIFDKIIYGSILGTSATITSKISDRYIFKDNYEKKVEK